MLRSLPRSGFVIHRSERRLVPLRAAFEKVCTRQEFNEAEGRYRANVGGKKILITEHEGTLYCVSNVCTHLNLPLVGRTGLAQAKVDDGCIECSFHKTKFKLDSGEVVGEWAPSFPSVPFVGKGDPKPLPIYEVRESPEGDIEVSIE